MHYHNRCCNFTENAPCRCEPIVLAPRTCVVNRYYPIEQPVIVPMHTRIINNYVPVRRYYPEYTTSEENCCRGGSEPVNEQDFRDRN